MTRSPARAGRSAPATSTSTASRTDGAAARAPGGPRPPDDALAGAADRTARGVAAPLRRRVQRQLPRLPVAARDGLAPGRRQGALHRARPRPAARPRALAAADRRPALGAAARGPPAPVAAQADAAVV